MIHTSTQRHGGDGTEQIAQQVGVGTPCGADEQHARRDASVEQNGHHYVCRSAPCAHAFDDHGTGDREDHGAGNSQRIALRESSSGPCKPPGSDAREGHVADAVAEQRHAALHQVGADDGCGRAYEQAHQQHALDEGIGQEAHAGPSKTDVAARGRHGVLVGVFMLMSGHGVHPKVLRRGAFVDHSARVEHHGAVDVAREGTQLVQHDDDRDAVLLEVAKGVGKRYLRLEIHARHGFIKNEHVGFADEGARDQDPLLLAP